MKKSAVFLAAPLVLYSASPVGTASCEPTLGDRFGCRNPFLDAEIPENAKFTYGVYAKTGFRQKFRQLCIQIGPGCFAGRGANKRGRPGEKVHFLRFRRPGCEQNAELHVSRPAPGEKVQFFTFSPAGVRTKCGIAFFAAGPWRKSAFCSAFAGRGANKNGIAFFAAGPREKVHLFMLSPA